MHLDAGQLGQDVGRVLQRGPVELQVLAGGEMAVAAIVFARDLGELAHLARTQRAVGHGDAQHVGVQLQIEAVHQPVRAELVLGQLAGEPAPDLLAELVDARGDEGGVEFVIAIHAASPSARARRAPAPAPAPACRDRGARSAPRRGSPRATPWARSGRCAVRPRCRRDRRAGSRRPLPPRGRARPWSPRRRDRRRRRAKSSLQPPAASMNRTTPSDETIGGDDLSQTERPCAGPETTATGAPHFTARRRQSGPRYEIGSILYGCNLGDFVSYVHRQCNPRLASSVGSTPLPCCASLRWQ